MKKKIICVIILEILIAFLLVIFADKIREIKIFEFFIDHFRDIMSY